ncbi:MAG: DUF6883 domain-containing protein [Bacteroidota bacterium]
MKLPFQNNLIMDDDKISNYLLDILHPSGKDKAEFFISHKCNADLLKELILKQAKEEDYLHKFNTPFGEKYVLESIILLPDLTPFKLRSVWIVLNNQSFTNFVTAYPVK